MLRSHWNKLFIQYLFLCIYLSCCISHLLGVYYPNRLTIPFLSNFLVHCFILDPTNKCFKLLTWSPWLIVLLTFCHSHLIISSLEQSPHLPPLGELQTWDHWDDPMFKEIGFTFFSKALAITWVLPCVTYISPLPHELFTFSFLSSNLCVSWLQLLVESQYVYSQVSGKYSSGVLSKEAGFTMTWKANDFRQVQQMMFDLVYLAITPHVSFLFK